MSDRRRVANEILDHLAFYKAMGVTWTVVGTDLIERGTSTLKRSDRPGQAVASAGSPDGAVAPHTPNMFESIATERESLTQIRQDLGDCQRCKLAPMRKNIVFGTGNPHAELMFVGEAPGADEDEQGLPFVGRAGQLLTKIIVAMGMAREDVYICNILKCRPPGNRNPESDEISSCQPFLFRQIDSIKPKVICALGTFGAQTLLRTREPISRLRGHFIEFRGARLMATFHPAYLLRNPNEKRKVWEDVQKIRDYLNSLRLSQ